jgi:hypothetical protein
MFQGTSDQSVIPAFAGMTAFVIDQSFFGLNPFGALRFLA